MSTIEIVDQNGHSGISKLEATLQSLSKHAFTSDLPALLLYSFTNQPYIKSQWPEACRQGLVSPEMLG